MDDPDKPMSTWRRIMYGRTGLVPVNRIARLEREVAELKRRLTDLEGRQPPPQSG